MRWRARTRCVAAATTTAGRGIRWCITIRILTTTTATGRMCPAAAGWSRCRREVTRGRGGAVGRGTRRVRIDRGGTFIGSGGIMRRIAATPRPDWQRKVEEAGLTWHTGEQPYWNEAAFYEFTAKEVDVLEAATNELETMTLQAAQHVIDNKLYARLAIPESRRAADRELAGRRSRRRSTDGSIWPMTAVNPPKLLEYNADTPTSLLEAAVVQWYWLQDCFPKRDQFNSLHERLVALWKELAKYLPGRRIDFCSMDDAEDGMTVTYLQDTAQQAGLEASIFPIDEIGWDGSTFLGPGRSAAGSGFQALSVGVDDARGVRQAHRGGGDDLARAAVEDAALQQGHSADSVAAVSAASLSAGVELRRSRTDDGVGEEADAGARGREHTAAPAGARMSRPAAITAKRDSSSSRWRR